MMGHPHGCQIQRKIFLRSRRSAFMRRLAFAALSLTWLSGVSAVFFFLITTH